MAKIIEFLTVNAAVKDIDEAKARYEKMGLHPHAPNRMPEPPAQITDVSIPLGEVGCISLISPTDDASPVAGFLAKRGEGVYSVAVRVDNLAEAMAEWTHVDWVLPEPYVFPKGTPALDNVPEQLLANWVKPRSLAGLMLEVFEFQGKVEKWQPAAAE